MKNLTTDTTPVFSRKIRQAGLASGAFCVLGVGAASAQNFTYEDAAVTNGVLNFNPFDGTAGGSFDAFQVSHSSGAGFDFTASTGYEWQLWGEPPGGGLTFVSGGTLIDSTRWFGPLSESSFTNYCSATFFVGFRQVDESNHYGWAQITIAPDGFTLHSSAYNPMADAGIQAGVAAIPEPGTTALLMGAAALVAIWVKRLRPKRARA